INESYIEQLNVLKVEYINDTQNIWVLLQHEDEVLDYREALKKYNQCKVTCEQGGAHSFIGFDRYLP
ncbi:YqiA/YcfP family alpha/beta fold hydrolase, partial [Psychromonas arctica]